MKDYLQETHHWQRPAAQHRALREWERDWNTVYRLFIAIRIACCHTLYFSFMCKRVSSSFRGGEPLTRCLGFIFVLYKGKSGGLRRCEVSFINAENNHNVNDQILLTHPSPILCCCLLWFYALKTHFMCILSLVKLNETCRMNLLCLSFNGPSSKIVVSQHSHVINDRVYTYTKNDF